MLVQRSPGWLGRTFRLLDKFKGEPNIPDIAEAAFQRAFVIDPDLACAHQSYTHLQVDLSMFRRRWSGWQGD